MTEYDGGPQWSARDEERLGLEQVVTATAMLNPSHFPALAEIITPDMLRHTPARAVWELLAQRIPAGEPVDYWALQLAMPDDVLKKIGGPTVFSSLGMHNVGDAEWHAEELRRFTVRDRIAAKLRGALTRIEHDDDLEAAIEVALTAVTDLDTFTAGVPSAGSDWDDVDLTSVLSGTYKPSLPTVGARDDGIGLFYPGRVNGIQGESEAGKSWVALVSCLVEINRGNHVFYLDFEDSEEGVIGRLLLLGALPQDIADRFHYIRPGGAPSPLVLKALASRVREFEATLVVVDGVTEAMTMMGLELKENTDIAKFGRALLRPLADAGAAVVPLDHVVKSTESRGRYSLGGVHKLNGVDGVQYMLEAVRPFGINTEGRSRLRIAKDRPAQVRKHALPGGKNPMHWFADLVIRSEGDEYAEAHLYPPIQRTDDPAEMTAAQEKAAKDEAEASAREAAVLQVLTEATEPLSKNAIEDLVSGNRSTTRRALTRLVHAKQVEISHGARNAVLHSLPAAPETAS
ncbi:AAA family ATPase [Streptomyces sp. ActVer]|uniref:AAA family ATPase n=1 Tax=Streptomyces sp. ActVer TaxID=3014558 RepID=UPI0022B56BAA|nr:AAA family ATPase [Streptomyces sp. ActVer]MCZ4510296.1 AAA family ATPase [Streptomyces sp. ActVer]